MSETMALASSLAAGTSLGVFFFGGLWWTVLKGVSSARPAVWFLGSHVLRMGVALTGFFFVAGGHWGRLLACLLGFLAARVVITRLTLPAAEKQSRLAKEASHAP